MIKMSGTTKTWLIVGASRGIGLEFVRQIVPNGHRVIATVRSPNSEIDALAQSSPEQVRVLTCDVSREESINVCFLSWRFSERIGRLKVW
jgi:NAD(P)-dependent dehydrogenase (short-subunit alcohol dehydrogenase family)